MARRKLATQRRPCHRSRRVWQITDPIARHDACVRTSPDYASSTLEDSGTIVAFERSRKTSVPVESLFSRSSKGRAELHDSCGQMFSSPLGWHAALSSRHGPDLPAAHRATSVQSIALAYWKHQSSAGNGTSASAATARHNASPGAAVESADLNRRSTYRCWDFPTTRI